MRINSLVNRLLPEIGHVNRMPSSLLQPLAMDSLWRDFTPMMPLMDVKDVKDSFIVKADCPGFTKDQIEIDAQGNTITLKGHCEHESKEGMVAQERFVSDFERMITLPASIKASEIKASLNNGVLEIKVPKDQPETSKIMIEG